MKNELFIFLGILTWTIGSAQYSEQKTLIESLSKTDTLKVQFASVGNYDNKCGGRRNNIMKFYYQDNQLVAQTTENGKLVYANVNDSQRKFLIAHEKESHSIDGRETFCEASSGYLYYINQDFKFRIIDQTCKWFGFSKMTENLFGFKF